MTPEPNKAIVRRYIDELNHRNPAILDDLVADEFCEVVRQGYHRNVTAFPDTFVKIHDMIAEGEQVAVEWTHRGVHRGLYHGIPATGKTITGAAISIYRVVDGRTTDARGIWDQSEVWQQLDLIPDTETILHARGIKWMGKQSARRSAPRRLSPLLGGDECDFSECTRHAWHG